LLWNLDSSDWDPCLAEIFGVPTQALPPSVPTRHAWGHLSSAQGQIPLTLVTGDQSAALFVVGEPASDAIMINLGTGAFLQQGLSHRPPPSRLLTSLAYQDQTKRTYSVEGTVNGAGGALTWAASELGLEEPEIIRCLPEWLRDYRQAPLFLNGVAGLGTPYLNPFFAPRFVGEGSAAEKCVAVCESIVFLLQVNLEEMARTAGPATRIIISGGLSKLDGLCQRLSDLSGLTLHRSVDHEASIRGLIELLIDTPRRAADENVGKKFLPEANPVLEGRYRAWRNEIESALGK
jgi:glycerol kinase